MQAGQEVLARDEWRQHGRIVLPCLAGMMLLAVHNYSLGAMIHPLEREFGWSRAEISVGPMIPSFAAVVLAPIVGHAVDRFGPRAIALAGVPLFTGALAALSLAGPSIFTWWGLYTLVGLASLLIFPMVWGAAINARFVRNRGLALAIILTGTGLTSTFVPWLATALLEDFGWRRAYLLLGALCFLVVFPLVWLLFDRTRAGVAPVRSQAPGAWREAARSPAFRKLCGAAFVFSLALCALTTNAVPILLSKGFGPMAAARMAGLVGIGAIAGRIGGGFLLDRFDARLIGALSMLAPATSALLLLGAGTAPLTAMSACFIIGLATGTEYDACAYLAARHFGVAHFGKLFGLISGMILVANGIAPALANHVYDLAHSYDPVLWAILPLLSLVAVLFLALGPYPDEGATEETDTRPLPATA